MNTLAPFISVDRPYNETLTWLTKQMFRSGLHVIQTFDLNSARLDIEDCTCPHHGTDKCDCQMIVLLVYGRPTNPATLILHGHDGQTWLSLVDTATQPADASLRASIEEAVKAGLQEGP